MNEDSLLKQFTHSKNAGTSASASAHIHTFSITRKKIPGKSARLLKQRRPFMGLECHIRVH